MKLFAAGLPYDMDDHELYEIFSEYGTVASAKVVTDRDTGKSRGFGFIEFPNKTEAESAMQALHGASLSGRELTVKEAEEKPRTGGPGRGGSRSGKDQRRGGFNRDASNG